MTSSSKVVWFLVIAATGAAGYEYGPWAKKEKAPVHYETATVDRGPVIAKVTASGTLSALVTVQVGSQVSGRVKEINVDFNSPVTKGQIIARIDPQLFNAAIEQARANYAAAQGDLAKSRAMAADAQRQLVRSKALAEKKLVAQADLDTSLANAEGADASVMGSLGRLAQAKASLSQAQVNLTYTNIISPIDGVVISRSVDVGQTVAASLQSPVLFILAEDLRHMQVDTSVAEADIGKLQAGMKTSFTVDAYPTQRFKGAVRQIRNAATNVQNVITYDAVIDVENPDLLLKPGMTANVRFVYAAREDALRIANAALRFRPTADMLGKTTDAAGKAGAGGSSGGSASAAGAAGIGAGGGGRHGRGGKDSGDTKEGVPDKRPVWILRGGKPVAAEVKVGVTDGSRSEVLEGSVKVGDVLITDAPSTDKPNSPSSGQMPMRRVL